MPSGGVVRVGSGRPNRPTRTYLERSIDPLVLPPSAPAHVTIAEDVPLQSPSVAVTETVTAPATVQVSDGFWTSAALSVPPVVVQ